MTVRPVRVAFLNHVGHAIGGGERSLLTFLSNCGPGIIPVAFVLEDGEFVDALRSAGIAVVVLRASSSLIRMKREALDVKTAWSFVRVAWEVSRELRRQKCDVLYTNSIKAAFIGSIAGRLAKRPCVMHFHDLIDGFGLQMLRLVATLGSTRRIACSDLVKHRIGLAKTTTIYGAVEKPTEVLSNEQARATLGLDRTMPIVSLIGRINRWKGLDRFLQIAALVSRRRPAQFLIVGSPLFRDADYLDELKRSASLLGIDDVVCFKPWTSDVATVLAATDVNANCSTREPLGRSPAEAAAVGVPSVVFDDSGAAEWMRSSGAGRVVPAGDEVKFAEAVLDLLEDAGERRHHSDRLRTIALQFDAVHISKQTEEVIRMAVQL